MVRPLGDTFLGTPRLGTTRLSFNPSPLPDLPDRLGQG